MKVTGPAWPSTAALRAALASVEGPDLAWGQGGKNGYAQLQAFTTAGLPCPVFTANKATAIEWVRAGKAVFGRRLHHTQGSDIIGPGYRAARQIKLRTGRTKLSPERWNQAFLSRDFWVQVIPSVAEYRQHVWNGRCIRVGKKVQSGETWRKQLVRSRNNGWHLDYGFKSSSPDFTEKIRALAKQAVEACGYPGGAVDILEGPDGKLYVLEVNSAPALTDVNTLGAYVKAITRQVTPKKAKAKKSTI